MFTGPLFQIKLRLLVMSYSVELWNPLWKAVSVKLHGSGGHGKRTCLQDQPFWQVSGMANYLKFYTTMFLPQMLIFLEAVT